MTQLWLGHINTVREHEKPEDDEVIGRSKGGLTTKIHAIVDTLGNPTGFFLIPGQAHDLHEADASMPLSRVRPTHLLDFIGFQKRCVGCTLP